MGSAVESMKIIGDDLANSASFPTIVGGDFNVERQPYNQKHPPARSDWSTLFDVLKPIGFSTPLRNDLLAGAYGGATKVPNTFHAPDYDPRKGGDNRKGSTECIDYIIPNDSCLSAFAFSDTKILKVRGAPGARFPVSRSGDVSDHYA